MIWECLFLAFKLDNHKLRIKYNYKYKMLRRTQLKCPLGFNPFKPEFTIVILIHYKSRIAAAILDL